MFRSNRRVDALHVKMRAGKYIKMAVLNNSITRYVTRNSCVYVYEDGVRKINLSSFPVTFSYFPTS